jgi:hypothetical protein
MLAAALPVTGHETEAHETLSRYLSLSGTTVRTIARWKEQMPSGNLAFFGLRSTAFGGTAQKQECQRNDGLAHPGRARVDGRRS